MLHKERIQCNIISQENVTRFQSYPFKYEKDPLMKKLLQLVCVLLILSIAAFARSKETQTVCPKITEEALINPGMGWVCFHFSNRLWAYGTLQEPGDTLDWFPGCSTVYFRVPWAVLEPQEGKFRWDLIDSIAQSWIAKGKKIAFRITASENRYVYATPKWVKDAGAQGVEYKYPFVEFYAGSLRPDQKDAVNIMKKNHPDIAEEKTLWDPKFDDPVFLEKLDHFLAAMAKRYNGNPDVAFIDIGSLGLWGEGHTGFSSKLTQEETTRIAKIHIDLYKKHFPDTLLCINDDIDGGASKGPDFPGTDYAFSKGISLRDDSIFCQRVPRQWFHANMAQKFWPELPVILEHGHYNSCKEEGHWDKDLLAQSVEEYHASYLSIHGWPEQILKENRDVVDRINKRLGYRLELRSITFPKKAVIDQSFHVSMKWANVGVAPCLKNTYISLALKNEKGNIVWSTTNESFDLHKLPIAEAGKAKEIEISMKQTVGIDSSIPAMNDGVILILRDHAIYPPFGGKIPTVKPGTYDLWISVGRPDGKPEIALPLTGSDSFRRYKIGSIQIIKK